MFLKRKFSLLLKFLKNRKKKHKGLVLKFKGKNYSFSIISLIIFPIGIIILAVPLLLFFKTTEIVWMQELFAKHMVFFLNLFFDLGARTEFLSNTWFVTISQYTTVYINNGCVGLSAMSIFFVVILFTPHPQDPKTKEKIVWRKALVTSVSLTLIYFFNVFRAVIQFVLYSYGYPWSIVHDSQGALAINVVVHISIFSFCLKFLPEFYISIFYSIKLIYKQFKKGGITEILQVIKQKIQKDQKDPYFDLQKFFKKEKLDLYLIKTYKINLRIIQFLKENKYKYTARAIKNRIFSQQEKITEDMLEKMLHVLLNKNMVLSENFKGKKYYFI